MVAIKLMCLCCVLLAGCMLAAASASRPAGENAGELEHLIRETIENMIAESAFKEKIEGIISENGLEAGTKTCKDVIIGLKKRIDFLENKVNDMESKQNIQSEMTADLLHSNRNVKHVQEAPLEYLKDDERAYENDRPATDVSHVPARPNTHRLNRNRRASLAPIAFSAYLSHSNFHMSKGECVIFDKVLLNQGGGYNSTTGTFKPPLSGVYLFSFHFDTTSKLSFVQLAVDNQNIVDGVANPHTNARTDRLAQTTGGNTVIIHVRHGQSVQIRAYFSTEGEVASSDTIRVSTFSGALLF